MTDDVVLLLGMPRSGTTWLSQLFDAHPDFVVRLSPPYAHEFRGRLAPDSDADAWREVLAAARATDDPFMTQDWQRERGNLPARDDRPGARLAVKDTRFHELYDAAMRVLPAAARVVIVRDPRAVLDSWFRSPEFPEGADPAVEWRSGACRKADGPGEYWGFDDWVRLTSRYREAAAAPGSRTLVVSFEELVRDVPGVMASVLEWLGAPLADEVVDFASASHRRRVEGPYSVFRDPSAVLDRWRTSLDPAIAAAVARELEGTELEEHLS